MNTYRLQSLAVHLSCNTPQDKLDLSFQVLSDVTVRQVSFYEHNGVYWFCIHADRDINSVGFVSLRNCLLAFRGTIKALGFVSEDDDSLMAFLRSLSHYHKSIKKGIA